MNQDIADLVIFDEPISPQVFREGDPVVVVDNYLSPRWYDEGVRAFAVASGFVCQQGVVTNISDNECGYYPIGVRLSSGRWTIFASEELVIDEEALLLKDKAALNIKEDESEA